MLSIRNARGRLILSGLFTGFTAILILIVRDGLLVVLVGTRVLSGLAGQELSHP